MLLDLLFHHEQGWWNTSHGTSPPNLKFEPVRDGYCVRAVVGVPDAWRGVGFFASAKALPGQHGASSGAISRTTGAANGYVRTKALGELTGYSGVSWGGGSFSAVSGYGGSSGWFGSQASAGATAIPWEVGTGSGVGAPVQVSGVLNPTDEEIVALFVTMSKRRLTHVNNYGYNPNKYQPTKEI